MSKHKTILKVSLLVALAAGIFSNLNVWAADPSNQVLNATAAPSSSTSYVGREGSLSSSTFTESWGPQDRTFYTEEVPATEAVMNSISNNKEIGNEANFVRVREYISDTATNKYTDEVDVEVGKEYEIYVYYHNNAASNLTKYAQNVRLKMEIPEKVSKNQTAVVKGTITWNKGGSSEVLNVWDTAFLNTDETVYFRYVPGTLKIHNSGTEYGGQVIPPEESSNSIVYTAEQQKELFRYEGNGLKLSHYADESSWGFIPACNEYAGYVTFRVVADQPKFFVEKEVLDGEEWVDTIEAEPGDTLHFRIHYYNTGTVRQEGVNISDNLPKELLFEKDANATKEDENYKVKVVRIPEGGEAVTDEQMIDAEDFFGENGWVAANLDPGMEAIVYYDVKVAGEKSFSECSTDIWNKAQVATENGTQFDKVKITVKKDCTPPKKDCKTNPEMEECKEIPETGPVEIAIVSMIAFGISFGCFYLWRSSRTLKRLQADILTDDQGQNQDSMTGQEPKDEQ